MNAQARSKFPDLTDADWQSLGFSDPPRLQQYHLGLSNTIHPIFRRTNPKRKNDGMTIWPQYTQESDYQRLLRAIEPVLKLASALIGSTASLNILYHIGHSPRVYPADPVEFQGQPVMEIRPSIRPGSKERAIVRAELIRLAGSIYFAFRSADQKSSLSPNLANTKPTFIDYRSGINIRQLASSDRTETNGMASAINIRQSASSDHTETNGMASVIRINDLFLKQLATLYDRNDESTSQILTLQFKMALTICHEVAHAYGFAVDKALLIGLKLEVAFRDEALAKRATHTGFDSNEPFFEDHVEAEFGWLWETAVFGGRMECDHDNQDYPLFLVTWPGELAEGPFAQRRGNAYKIQRWIIPLHFIRAVHSDIFWRGIREGDATALHVQKIKPEEFTCIGEIDPLSLGPRSSSNVGYEGKDEEEIAGPEADPYLAALPRRGLDQDSGNEEKDEEGVAGPESDPYLAAMSRPGY